MIRAEHVTKRFGSTTAVDDVTLSLAPREIVGLVGENGAGKTTLMRVVAGELQPDAGSVRRGRVAMVHQHFTLVSHFTIAENLALASGRRAGVREAEAAIASTGIALPDVTRLAADLSVGEKSKLELIKAISAQPELLILDEPTSVLTPLESEELFRVIRGLEAAVVFISHKVPEVVTISDRVVVMRGGRVVADAKNMTAAEIAGKMVLSAGRRPSSALPGKKGQTPLIHHGVLRLHAREIVAILGVAGNGQKELVESLRRQIPRTARVAFIPEDRTREALIAEMTLAENIALGGDEWNPLHARARAERLITLYGVRARGPAQAAGELSGGNQQKVVLARELDRKPELIIAAEPTRGLDIEATAFVHQQLTAAVAAGAALLLITSDLDEAFSLADAVHVIYRGRLTPRLTPDEASQRIGPLMAGLS
jgi:simple sugar transport system ATP-binding protein